MKSIAKLLATCAVALIPAAFAQAQTELPQASGFAGLALGFAKPADVDGRLGYGANIGLMFPNGVTGFGYFLSSTGEESAVDTTISHFGLGGNYSLAALPGLYVGGRIGAVTTQVEAAGIDRSDTDFSVGPHVGYDFPLAAMFTIGGEASLMVDFRDDTDTTIYLLANAKYWF